MAPVDRRRTLAIAGIGTVAGLFSGLFGVGGGVVMVPLLILVLKMDERRATSTSLGAIVLIASAATVTQGAYGTLHVTEGLLVGVPALGGVLAGTWLQQRIPARRVSLIFAALLLVVAVSMVLSTGDADGSGGTDLDVVHVLLAAVFGFAAGVVSGLLGVGGGTLFVPGLIYVLGLGHVDAEATSLLAMVPMSLLGAWRQHRYGNLELRTSVTMGVLAIPGALLGVVLANALPVRVLEIGFALLLLYVAQRLGRRGLKKDAAAA
ncbi:sulfite exporter TauE/SafE family protein [Patulibacter sp. NPDC049589]|uniref:sulfite exporter TauE/SafE family protein n=1 Tax=Patulibacter sp. NPDC049589 TaxID=3154731 RepID=UPI00342A5FC2